MMTAGGQSSTSRQTEILKLWKLQILTENCQLKPVYELLPGFVLEGGKDKIRAKHPPSVSSYGIGVVFSCKEICTACTNIIRDDVTPGNKRHCSRIK